MDNFKRVPTPKGKPGSCETCVMNNGAGSCLAQNGAIHTSVHCIHGAVLKAATDEGTAILARYKLGVSTDA